jgi:Transposase DDE domain
MRTTSKSPRRVLLAAYAAARAALRPYRHRYSPKKFTQPQLFACLVLKEFLHLDYRGLTYFLEDVPELARLIDLTAVPHFTTFHKAADRLLRASPARRVFDAVLRHAIQARVLHPRPQRAALDATGLESRYTSRYFLFRQKHGQTRRQQQYTTHPMASLLCDCASLLVVALVAGRGPRSAIKQVPALLRAARRRVRIRVLLADADYDAEWVHVHARTVYGMRSWIPPKRGRPTSRAATGRWRRRMQTHWNQKAYGQRWQAEIDQASWRSSGSLYLAVGAA